MLSRKLQQRAAVVAPDPGLLSTSPTGHLSAAAAVAADRLEALQVQHLHHVRQILDDAVGDCEAEWKGRLRDAQDEFDRRVKELEQQVVQANEQLTDTVKMYNDLMHDLTEANTRLKATLLESETRHGSELSDLRRQMAESEVETEEKSVRYSHLLQEARKQIISLKEQVRNDELKFQQKKIVLLQANDELQKENQLLKLRLQQLDAGTDEHDYDNGTHAQSEAAPARAERSTARAPRHSQPMHEPPAAPAGTQAGVREARS